MSLVIKDIHRITLLEDILKLKNTKSLTLINCLLYNDDYVSIMKELKNLNYLKIGSLWINQALDDPELDEEEKRDLKKGGVFNPMRWNESNFKKYFGDIQNKIEDALHNPNLDDDEKGDLKRFRKKGIFNLFYWNENNFKKYFDDIDVKTYGIFDEVKMILEMKKKQDQERENDIYYKYRKLSKQHEILSTKYNEFHKLVKRQQYEIENFFKE
ncbi:476_t:CDS:2 [Scutellospora calospora]|uniref:476_t:CDS:1 n=1 Tax=Scutellospora calospora TaxID=85575 RepID=A0ACA9MVU3_9GLOM|nr:476_t:CDS:2 [Scutellospora calospora]